MRRNNQSGSIALEASIVLTLFIFFVLALYSFFKVFEVQGKITSTLLQCAQSLSLDPYNIDRTGASFDDKEDSVLDLLVDFGIDKCSAGEEYVTTSDAWYKDATDAKTNEALATAIEDRFFAYLTFDGTEEDLLNKYKVENGVDGLDFSESNIDSEGNLNITVKYKVNYIFDCPTIDLPPFEFKHTTSVHLWRDTEVKYEKKSEE